MLKKTMGRNIREVLENPFLELVHHLEMPGNPWALYYFTDNRPKNSARGVVVERRTGEIIHRLSKTISGSSKRKPTFMPYAYVFNLEHEIQHYFFNHAIGDVDLVNALDKCDQAMIKTLDPFYYTLIDLYRRVAYARWPTEKFERWPTFPTMTTTVNHVITVHDKRRYVGVTRTVDMRKADKQVQFDVSFGLPTPRYATYGVTITRKYNLKGLPTVRQFLDNPQHQPIYDLVFRDYDATMPPRPR